jgi:hypothetical protein
VTIRLPFASKNLCSVVRPMRAAGLALGLALAAGLAAPARAEPQAMVETLDGKKLQGEIRQLSAESLTIDAGTGAEKFATSSVQSVKPVSADAQISAKPTCYIELIDGSQLMAVACRVKDGRAAVELAGGIKLELSTKVVRSVRFQGEDRSDRLAGQWSQIAGGKAASDLLIVRKQGALDYLEGVLGNVDDETVQFELDHDTIPVKRAKIEGMIYYHADNAELPEAVGVAVERGGSHWQIRAIELAADQCTITTPAGLKVARPFTALERLDFSAANTQFLSDLAADKIEYAPYYPPRTDLPILADSYQPRRNIGFERGPLKLDGKTYAKGLALHSRTQTGYRLPGKFRRLKALVGIDDALRPGGDVQLEIRGDGKLLWQGAIRGSEPAKPLDLDIAGVKRIEILADFGADLDIADVIDLCEARVTK